MLTGVLAGLGGYLTIRSTNLSNEAIYWSTQAGLKQSVASDKWAEMQANSIKATMYEIQQKVAPTSAPFAGDLAAQAKVFRDREPQLKSDAIDLQKHRDGDLEGGLQRLKEKDMLGYAGMAVQLGIALASIAALVKSPLSFYAAIVCAVIGIGTIIFALAPHYLH